MAYGQVLLQMLALGELFEQRTPELQNSILSWGTLHFLNPLKVSPLLNFFKKKNNFVGTILQHALSWLVKLLTNGGRRPCS